jgi:2-oxo-4-hydroxy-4-carboxy-5-ureidoimidazoline decarboxylase
VLVHHFNELDRRAAVDLVRPCVGIASWVEAVVDGRPHDDVDAAVAAGDADAATWSAAAVDAALADHPRIGERPTGGGTGAALSRKEQAGVDPADADVAARLADGNRRYEQTFDRIYLVRAAGRTAEEMLALLEQRLAHDPVTEAEVVRGQLAEIAALRLRGLLVDADEPVPGGH